MSIFVEINTVNVASVEIYFSLFCGNMHYLCIGCYGKKCTYKRKKQYFFHELL